MANVPSKWKIGNFMQLADKLKLTWLYNKCAALSADIEENKLPNVSSHDNGKVLGVKSGKWSKMDVPEELPSVTADDNGDVLTVVSGAWAKAAPSGGGSGVFEILYDVEWDEQLQDIVVSCNKTIQEINTAIVANDPILIYATMWGSIEKYVPYYINFYYDPDYPAVTTHGLKFWQIDTDNRVLYSFAIDYDDSNSKWIARDNNQERYQLTQAAPI